MPRPRPLHLLSPVVLILATVLCIVAAPRASATPTYHVTSVRDAHDPTPADGVCDSTLPSHVCTLRAAVETADAVGAATIDLPAGTYAPAGSGLTVSVPLTIQGAGARGTTVDGAGITDMSSMIYVQPAGSLIVYGLTLRNTSAFYGGALFNAGGASLLQVAVLDNHATDGGGIVNQGHMKIDSSTIAGNSGSIVGGGIFQASSSDPARQATLAMADTTVSGNSSRRGGGGVYAGGLVYLKNVTVAGNVANTGHFQPAANYGGAGIDVPAGGFGALPGRVEHIDDTLLIGNTRYDPTNPALPDDCSNGGGASGLASYGYNLIGATDTCLITAAGDQTGTPTTPIPTASVVGSFGDNGGPTDTIPLIPGGPAVDTGSPIRPSVDLARACTYRDQRGIARPVDGDGNGRARCDIGAVELVPLPRMIIRDSSAIEGDKGSTQMLFRLELSHAYPFPVGAEYYTKAGTATSGKDYLSTKGLVRLEAGQTKAVIPIRVIGDTTPESDETFSIVLAHASNAIVRDGHAIGTIVDDD